jgi:hypothetical protein
MGGSALLHTVTFGGVIVAILLTVWIALLLESGGRPPHDGARTGSSSHPDQEARQ